MVDLRPKRRRSTASALEVLKWTKCGKKKGGNMIMNHEPRDFGEMELEK
jgi:hypothetical protein